ncbi:hypothetical protein I4F81_009121 [Pyropia yezoensis]|uniref:Uncharacterized protein n=1 Tax=Pyropia yezoensis TaxID=2788 RepID=A0ACC3C912_PYRYE|nr:hypothetical protein I4F81_009121 [Neopyropia yezoensis]
MRSTCAWRPSLGGGWDGGGRLASTVRLSPQRLLASRYQGWRRVGDGVERGDRRRLPGRCAQLGKQMGGKQRVTRGLARGRPAPPSCPPPPPASPPAPISSFLHSPKSRPSPFPPSPPSPPDSAAATPLASSLPAALAAPFFASP